jgi:hypothetical protein
LNATNALITDNVRRAEAMSSPVVPKLVR